MTKRERKYHRSKKPAGWKRETIRFFEAFLHYHGREPSALRHPVPKYPKGTPSHDCIAVVGEVGRAEIILPI